jgi:hypothetical protein
MGKSSRMARQASSNPADFTARLGFALEQFYIHGSMDQFILKHGE